jgi:outer membrane protein assembly factor BamB
MIYYRFKRHPLLFALVLAIDSTVHAAPSVEIEDLGQPVWVRDLEMHCVTRNAAGVLEAWGRYETNDKFAMVGVRLDDGKLTWVDVSHLGLPPNARHIWMISAADGNLYAFTAKPGRFLKYDVTTRTLHDLGVPSQSASYCQGYAVGPDGKFYIGTYPDTELVQCDPATGKVKNLGRLATDEQLKYVPHPVVSDDNVVYCPVGLHHGELWAFDPRTGERRQILPKSMLKEQGSPEVWRGEDGRVYGKWVGEKFLCTPTSIVVGKTSPTKARSNPLAVGDTIVGDIDAEGRLKLTHNGRTSHIQTDYAGAPRSIYSVSCDREGRIYGGTIAPANTFCFDPATKKFTDFGQISGGGVQVYDTLNHPRGLFISSYMNASVDFFDPSRPVKKGKNPQRVVTLDDQERPAQEVIGPDGMLYTGTVPSKGRLGDALLRVNVNDLSYKVWKDIIANQSIHRLVSVPATGEVLGATSINGGSSAIPIERKACIFLWDCKQEKVVFTAQPLSKTMNYGAVVRAKNGIVYGVEGRGGNRYYAFDPVSRKTLFAGVLPVKTVYYPELVDEPFGPQGLIYGLGDDAIFAIDPADHSARIIARDAGLKDIQGFHVAQDGMLYFGSGSHLKRCRLDHP